jgi:flagellar biosynthesis protein FlhG
MMDAALPMLNVSRFDIGRLKAFRRFMEADRRMKEGVQQSAKVVCVASGKGGTGKSILASNLATARALAGERVLLIDFDAGLANAHLLLGLAPAHDMGDVLSGKVTVRQALVEGPGGLHLLSGGVGRPALANPTRRELDRLFKALQPLESDYDLIVVDHGAGMSYGTVTHLAATSTLVLVTNPEITALSDAYALYKRAHMVNDSIHVGLVVNRAHSEQEADFAWERFQSVSKRFLGHTPEWIGWVPFDNAVRSSVHHRRPVTIGTPDSAAARALSAVARWSKIDLARTSRPFYERARKALR